MKADSSRCAQSVARVARRLKASLLGQRLCVCIDAASAATVECYIDTWPAGIDILFPGASKPFCHLGGVFTAPVAMQASQADQDLHR